MSASPVASPAPGLRVPRCAIRVGGWSLLVLGLVHLGSEAGAAGQHDAATRKALEGLAQVRVALPGLQPSLAELFFGFSLMVGLLLLTTGTLLLRMASHAEQAPALLTNASWVLTVFSATGLLLSWMYLPLPPLLGLALALTSGLTGLLTARRLRI